MFAQVTLQDWENLVKKQLKSEDIYAVLTKENLEGIFVKQYYADIVQKAVFALAKWQYILYIEIVKATENRKYEHTKTEDSFKPQLCSVSIF